MAVDTLARAIAAGKVPVDAYEMAVAGGYTGTKEQFEADLGNSGTNATNAASSASAAAASATTASNAAANFAPTYSTSATYAVGDYVLYNSGLYECNTAITTAEAWTAAHWTAVKVGPELTDLKNAIDDIAGTTTGTNKCNPDAMSNGRYTQINDGVHSPAFVETSDYILTDYLPIGTNRYVFVGAYYNNAFVNQSNGIVLFDDDKVSIGSVTDIQTIFDIQTVTGYANAVYVRAWWKKVTYPDHYFIALDTTQKTYRWAPYIETTTINDEVKIPQVDDLESYVNEFVYKGVGVNKCNPSAMSNGRYTVINDGETAPAWISDNTRVITDYIEVTDQYFIGSAYNSSGVFVPEFNGLAVFDEFKNALGSIAGVNGAVKLSTAFSYNNIKYVRAWWTISSYPSGYMVSFNNIDMSVPYIPYGNTIELVENVKTMPSNWFVNKVGETLGDSITQQFRWQPTTAFNLGCKLINNGIGGTPISGDSANAFWKDTRVNALSNDADFVIIMGGTNDTSLTGFSIGTIERTNYDTSTLCGAYNVLLSKLYYKYLALASGYYSDIDYSGVTKRATAKYVPIYICTPIYCAYEGHDTMDDIAEAVKQIADMWAIPCIDVNGTCRINAFNSTVYLADAMHPNNDGGIMLAQAMINGLVDNQPFIN